MVPGKILADAGAYGSGGGNYNSAGAQALAVRDSSQPGCYRSAEPPGRDVF